MQALEKLQQESRELWQLAAHNQGAGYEQAASDVDQQIAAIRRAAMMQSQSYGFCQCAGSQNDNGDGACHNCGCLL